MIGFLRLFLAKNGLLIFLTLPMEGWLDRLFFYFLDKGETNNCVIVQPFVKASVC